MLPHCLRESRKVSQLNFFHFILLLFSSVNFLPLTFPILKVLALLLVDPTTSTCLPFKLNSLCSNYLLCSILTSQLFRVHCYQDSSHRILLVIRKGAPDPPSAGSNLFICVTIQYKTTYDENVSLNFVRQR